MRADMATSHRHAVFVKVLEMVHEDNNKVIEELVTSGFLKNQYDLHNSLLSYWKIWDGHRADGVRIVVPTAQCHLTLQIIV